MSADIGKAFIAVEPSMAGFAPKLRAGLASQSGAGGIFGKAGKVGGLAFTAGLTGAVAVTGFLGKLGGDFHNAYAKIRTETGQTGKSLGGLQGSFDKVFANTPASMDDVATAISSVSKRLGLTGKPLESLSLQAIRLSRITKTDLKGNLDAVVPLLEQWGLKGDKAGGTLDMLFRASQKSGVGVAQLAGELTGAGVQLRAVGLDINSSTALLGVLGKAGLSASDVMPAISKAMAKAAKDGKSAGKVFSDTFAGIKNAKSDVEASGIALDVFGARAGPKLAALIRSGKLSWDDFQKSIAHGDSIEQAAKDTGTWQSKLQILGHQISVSLKPLATRVFNSMGSAVKSATPAISLFATTLGVAVGAISHVPGPIIAALGALGVLGIAVKKLSGPVKTMWSGLKLMGSGAKATASALKTGVTTVAQWGKQAAIAAVNTGRQVAAFVAQKAAALGAAVAQKSMAAAQWLLNAAMDANPIGLAVVAIGALVAGVVLAYQHFKPFREVVQAVGRAFVTAGKAVIGGIGVALSWVRGHWPLILAIPKNWDKIKAGFRAVKEFIGARVGDIVGFITGIPRRIAKTVAGLWDGLKNGITVAKNWVRDRISDVVGFVTKLPGRISKAASGLFDGIKDAFRSAINFVIRGWNSLHFGLPKIHLPKLLGGGTIGGQSFGVPQIKELATGGIITEPTLALLGETARARPEIAAPAAMLRRIFSEELARPRFAPVARAAGSARAPQLVPAIARVDRDAFTGRAAAARPIDAHVELHTHGGDVPTMTEIDAMSRVQAFRLRNTGRRP